MSDAIDIKFLALAWTVLTFLFSAGIAYGTMRLTLRYHGKEIGDIKGDVARHKIDVATRLEANEHFVKGALFRPSGVTNYLPREECEQCRIACQNRIDTRLESMLRIIEEGERKRDASKDQWSEEFRQLAQQIGRLEGKLGNGGRK